MFETDIFISFSHKDDEPLPGEKAGWVSDLHQALQVRVGQLLGQKPTIWRDPLQSGNVHIPGDIYNQLRKTATLVSILSPSYFTSTWCPLELDAFCEACQSSGGLRVGNRARIFKVLKTRLQEEEKIPPAMRDCLGYEFYAFDDTTEKVREFWRAFGDEERQRFYQKADDLAQDISRMLRQMRGMNEQPSPEARKNKGFVYLAVSSSDLNLERESLFRDLHRSGYTVLPEHPLPATALDVEAAVRQDLIRCRLSVHMIGRNYGLVPDGTALSIPELQNDLAAEHSKRSALARLVWLAPVPPVEDPRQKEFIDRLQTAPEQQDKMVPFQGSLGDLKEEVHRWLERAPQTAEARVSPRQEMMPPRVYLICNESDDVRAVQKLLFDGGCEPVLPLFTGDEGDIRQEHEDNLRSCDGVVLYWGVGGEDWRRKKENEVLLKSIGLGRTQGAPLTLLYIAPPASRDKETLLTRKVLVVREPPEGPAASLLAAFLEKLRDDASKASDEPV